MGKIVPNIYSVVTKCDFPKNCKVSPLNSNYTMLLLLLNILAGIFRYPKDRTFKQNIETKCGDSPLKSKLRALFWDWPLIYMESNITETDILKN